MELFALYCILFLLLAIARVRSPLLIPEMFRALFNMNYAAFLSREGRLGAGTSQLLLDAVFLSSVALFLLFDQTDTEGVRIFMNILLVIAGFYGLRLLIIKLFFALFFGSVRHNPHISEILLFNRLTGIVLLPGTFLLFYLAGDTVVLGHVLLLMLIGLGAWRFIRIYSRILSLNTHRFIYIFLYLCTTELIPFVLLYKALNQA